MIGIKTKQAFTHKLQQQAQIKKHNWFLFVVLIWKFKY